MNSSHISQHLFTCDKIVIFNILVNIVILKDLFEKVFDIVVEKSEEVFAVTNLGSNLCDLFQKYEPIIDVNFD